MNRIVLTTASIVALTLGTAAMAQTSSTSPSTGGSTTGAERSLPRNTDCGPGSSASRHVDPQTGLAAPGAGAKDSKTGSADSTTAMNDCGSGSSTPNNSMAPGSTTHPSTTSPSTTK